MIEFRNSSATGEITGGSGVPVAVFKPLLTGASKGTIVKSLEIMTGNESSYVEIVRTNGNEGAYVPSSSGSYPTFENALKSNEYATIRIDMKANDYLVLWEGFFVVPSGHRLYFRSDSTLCKSVANYVDVT
jgi:hypothetical protein